MFLGPRYTSDLMAMVSFTFTMRRHLIRLTSAPFTSCRLTNFGWVLFTVCNAWQRSRTPNLRRAGENSSHILSRLSTKVHKIFRLRRRPLVFANALNRLSISSFTHKIFAIKSRNHRKTEQMYTFLAPNFWEIRPRLFYGRLLARCTVHRLAKLGLVPFVDINL